MSRATVGLLSSATAGATTATSSFSRSTLGFGFTNSPTTPSTSSTSSSSSCSSSCLTVSFLSRNSLLSTATTRRTPRIRCEVAIKSDSKTSSDLSTPSPPSSTTEEVGDGGAKIGARVRVKVPLKVYHVPRVPEVDLSGKEGVLKQYVGIWKGKRISANFPYKVEFFIEVEGRGPVKFFAHLKEEEFEYI